MLESLPFVGLPEMCPGYYLRETLKNFRHNLRPEVKIHFLRLHPIMTVLKNELLQQIRVAENYQVSFQLLINGPDPGNREYVWQ
jgi:hypothetical protein